MRKTAHVSPVDFAKLKNTIDALDTTVTKSVEKLDQTLKVSRVPDNRKVKRMLKDLKKTVTSTAEKDQELRAAENYLARLEEEVEGTKS